MWGCFPIFTVLLLGITIFLGISSSRDNHSSEAPINGVLGPFSSLQGGSDFIHLKPCPLPNTNNSTYGDSKNVVDNHSSEAPINGVLGPFSSLQGGSDFIHSKSCALPNTNNSTYGDSKNVGEWNRVVHLLGSKGYSSFSAALHSVLDGIRKDLVGLGFATIFAPPDLTTTLPGYPSTLLDRAVRLHIVPRRFTYGELTSLPVRTRLKTLMPDDHPEIDVVLGFMRGVVINGVEIDAPDMFTSEKFVVHGISRAFKMAALTPS